MPVLSKLYAGQGGWVGDVCGSRQPVECVAGSVYDGERHVGYEYPVACGLCYSWAGGVQMSVVMVLLLGGGLGFFRSVRAGLRNVYLVSYLLDMTMIGSRGHCAMSRVFLDIRGCFQQTSNPYSHHRVSTLRGIYLVRPVGTSVIASYDNEIRYVMLPLDYY